MGKILDVQGLSKSFGKKKVLKNVTFSLQAGEIIGLVGPNGAGKTTIMKAILGLVHYQEGNIWIGAHRISRARHKGLEKTGALIENPGIYPFLTGFEHLKLFAEKESKDDLSTIITKLKMENYIHEKSRTYSLGMKQKLGIALSLLNRPELIILDEPTSGLDPGSVRDVRETILSLVKQGTSFLVSSHILSELEKIADTLVIIHQGEVIQQCSVTDIMHQSKHYVVLFTSDDHSAKRLLEQSGILVEAGTSIKIRKENDEQVGSIIQLLVANGIQVLDLQHPYNDLETSLFTWLNNRSDV